MVSMPTSRWSTTDSLSAWTTSMGCSMVTMWQRRVSLMWSTIAASVDVRPEPGEAADEDEPRRRLGELRRRTGEAERVDRRDAGDDAPQDDADDARAGGTRSPGSGRGPAPRGPRRPRRGSRAPPPSGRAAARPRARCPSASSTSRAVSHERAVDAHVRARTHLQVDVGGALLDRESEELVEIQHARGIDRGRRRPLTHGPPTARSRCAGCVRDATPAPSAGRRRRRRWLRGRRTWVTRRGGRARRARTGSVAATQSRIASRS